MDNLSAEEKEYLAKILSQLESSGSSAVLDGLWATDYIEKPVSIYEFMTNDDYLGKSLKDDTGRLTIYDYWVDKLETMFDDSESNQIQEVALSGCIGSGKSTCAVIGLAYSLYRLLCLKSPASYYNLTKNSRLALAFFNVTLNQSYGVGYAKLQDYCKASPWFCRHGKVIGRSVPTYYPNNIDILVGSKNEHFIGHDIFCLDGDTQIATESGFYAIKDLTENPKKVFCVDKEGITLLSDKEVYSIIQDYTDSLIELELEDNTVIRCTPEHLFYTKDGRWVKACDLTENDELFEGVLA